MSGTQQPRRSRDEADTKQESRDDEDTRPVIKMRGNKLYVTREPR